MTVEEKLRLLEEALEMDEGTLKSEMLLDDVEEYDSLTMLGVIAMLEDSCGVRVDGGTMRGLKTVRDILDLMK